MTTIILALAGPVLGLLGVIAGLWYGQRRWRREREDKQRNFYETKRKEAYAGLWEVVQDAHLGMRASLRKSPSLGFPAFLTNVNSFMWKHGVYIESLDRELAQEYLFLVYEFLRLVSQSEGAREWIELSVEFPSSPRGPSDPSYPANMPSTLIAMRLADNEANIVRDRLVERIRLVLGAPPAQSVPPMFADGQVLATRFKAMLGRELDGSEEARGRERVDPSEQISLPDVNDGPTGWAAL